MRSLFVLALVVALAGCARTADTPLSVSHSVLPGGALSSDTAPLVDAALAIDLGAGRVTGVHEVFRVRVVPPGGEPGAWLEFVTDLSYSIVGTQTHHGIEYQVEEETEEGGPGGLQTAVRQDRSGYYAWQADLEPTGRGGSLARSITPERSLADAAIDAAIATYAAGGTERDLAIRAAFETLRLRRAAIAAALGERASDTGAGTFAGPPGGPGIAEITFLRYPLHPGASWIGREGFNVWTVETREPLLTAAGRFATARVRIDLPKFFGPNDHYHGWWAAPGEIQRIFYAESEATDEFGNVIGTAQSEEVRTLVSYAPGS